MLARGCALSCLAHYPHNNSNIVFFKSLGLLRNFLLYQLSRLQCLHIAEIKDFKMKFATSILATAILLSEIAQARQELASKPNALHGNKHAFHRVATASRTGRSIIANPLTKRAGVSVGSSVITHFLDENDPNNVTASLLSELSLERD
jgi:hypothetical protein